MIKFPRLSSTLVLSILVLSTAYSQSNNSRVYSYINQYKELAISEMLRTGVPASVTLAQGILETAGGQSDLAALANNHFGIKCKSEWTGDYMLHNDDAKNECFRKYSSVEESYRDHSDFLRSRPNYAFLFKLDPTDFEGWAKGLKKAGYATSSTYSNQLIKLIVENNLQDFTLMALQGPDLSTGLLANTVISEDVEVATSLERGILKQSSKVLQNSVSRDYPINTVFNINETKVVYAEAGTSLFALANNYNVSFKKLLEFNDLDQLDILDVNQLIFLEKKAKKGAKDIHIVEENETVYDISQKEGIQLSTVMEFNGLQKGMQPAAGEKIYLKNPAPTTPKLAVASRLKNTTSM